MPALFLPETHPFCIQDYQGHLFQWCNWFWMPKMQTQARAEAIEFVEMSLPPKFLFLYWSLFFFFLHSQRKVQTCWRRLLLKTLPKIDIRSEWKIKLTFPDNLSQSFHLRIIHTFVFPSWGQWLASIPGRRTSMCGILHVIIHTCYHSFNNISQASTI